MLHWSLASDIQGHIVVEVCDIDNEPLVRMVGGSAVETVVSHDIIGRLMIQCARQPGLATVWEQLMGFDGGCSHDGLQGGPCSPVIFDRKTCISHVCYMPFKVSISSSK